MAEIPKFSTDHSAQSYEAVYERDPRHVAVDTYMVSHLLSSRKNQYHQSLDKIYHRSLDAGLPDIACSPLQAEFLRLQILTSQAKNVLEIGTLGGYSAAWMATAGPDVHVTTIEIDKGYADLAAENIAEAGLSSQVEILLGPALEVLPRLLSEVRLGERKLFDFVFIDANKHDSLAYFNLALDMSRPHAAIVVDNVVRNGKVVSAAEAEEDGRVLGVRQLIEALKEDDRIDATAIQTVGEKNYDGFLIAVKR